MSTIPNDPIRISRNPGKPDMFRIRAFGLTDPGRVYEANEDAFFVSDQQGLFIVSDGMGGARAGALASSMTVHALPVQVSAEHLALKIKGPIENYKVIPDGLIRAIGFVNDLLLDKTRGYPEVKGLGATVVACLHTGNGVFILAHLGDSRAYLLRNGHLERLTEDHTVAEMLFQAGRISRRRLLHHPSKHILTRHIGKEDCPSADTAVLLLNPGDRILLCTDGLTNMLKEREIGTILLETKNREETCRLLIGRANEAGGCDNITAVIMDVEDLHLQNNYRQKRVRVRRKIGHSVQNTVYHRERQAGGTIERFWPDQSLRRIKNHLTGCPKSLSNVMDRALALEPKDRYQSDWEFLEAFREAL